MRRSNYLNSKRKNKNRPFIKLVFFPVLTFLIVWLCFIAYKVLTLERFQFVNNRDDNVEIIVIDNKREDVTKIFIDKNFYVDSSRNFGEYKIGSLWILGRKEKYQGRLVAETITKNFGIPVYLWKDGVSTNLNFFQKIKVLLSNINRGEYDFKLTSRNVKDSILVNFVHPATEGRLPKIRIDDLTGDPEVVNLISKILEVLGFKIVDYSKGFDNSLDCEVIGKSDTYTSILKELFDCKIVVDENQSIDLDIRIGKVFGDRF